MVNRPHTSSVHTAGPWQADWLGDERGWVLDAQNNYLAEIVTTDELGFVVPRDQQRANARLMAAAPDLYTCTRYLRLVCEDRLSIERETDNDPEVIEHYELLLADANAAISKVESQS
jgi:hypothetical protein